jgi:uncharacterized Tic20 family protein
MIQAMHAEWTDEPVTSEDRTMALLSHVGGYLTSFVIPLIFWLVYKDKSRFVAHHTRESLNFQISLMLYSIVISSLLLGLFFFLRKLMEGQTAMYLTLFLIGLFGLALLIFETVAVILASIAAYRGRSFRYPLCIRGV